MKFGKKSARYSKLQHAVFSRCFSVFCDLMDLCILFKPACKASKYLFFSVQGLKLPLLRAPVVVLMIECQPLKNPCHGETQVVAVLGSWCDCVY